MNYFSMMPTGYFDPAKECPYCDIGKAPDYWRDSSVTVGTKYFDHMGKVPFVSWVPWSKCQRWRRKQIKRYKMKHQHLSSIKDGDSIPGPIIGYRSWRKISTKDPILISLVFSSVKWYPGVPMYGDTEEESAGIYSYNYLPGFISFNIFVHGAVWLWGDIIEHEAGYRASNAYPAAFLVPKREAYQYHDLETPITQANIKFLENLAKEWDVPLIYYDPFQPEQSDTIEKQIFEYHITRLEDEK